MRPAQVRSLLEVRFNKYVAEVVPKLVKGIGSSPSW